MSLFNLKIVFAAFCIMFLSTACSKKIMPPEIETTSGGIEDSDFTASNTSPVEEANIEVTEEIGGSGGSSSDSDFFSAEPILEGSSDSVGAGTGAGNESSQIAENSFGPGSNQGSMNEFNSSGQGNIENGSAGSSTAEENPFVAGNSGNGGNSVNAGSGSDELARLTPFQETSQLQDIHFNFDQHGLDSSAKKTLQQNAVFLKQNPEVRIEIQGHCDERGTNNYNTSLGQRRAQATKKYLISQGIDSSRVNTISYGEDKPFCFDSNETCWYQNRRAHFMVAK
tara:strand:- start:3481 stop:4326 length:846 start_codon:yes stop_codon:yes gene_type:complete